MVGTSSAGVQLERKDEMKAFDEMKTGVKGLVDGGVTKVPAIFLNTGHFNVKDKEEAASSNSIPVIDLRHLVGDDDGSSRSGIVDRVRDACETWGFFQVINHEIPESIVDEMMEGVRRFHEQESQVKKEFYSRDETRKVKYNTNFDFYQAPSVNWRDTLYCLMDSHPPNPDQLPTVCRDVAIDYMKEMQKFGLLMFELLSEALGLRTGYLKDMGCIEGLYLSGHYYPPCPEPDLTMGISKHTDSGFITVVLQDHIGGLQVLHQDSWVNVTPIPRALVVNLGDMFQLISNDKFKSACHRVVSKKVGPRISVSCNFRTHFVKENSSSSRLYGPIKDLVSKESPPLYRETTIEEYITHFCAKGLDGTSALHKFKLSK
ncbi:hypothetical protein K2173_004783 [Erythroxylum novogranatense]|uniref:Fe2OG dioxygenase domain-containing protein n=1 Tax=Erythroxylum novogranatense TaxID=1862640 RepID=A0AAV8SKB5_9ROSI|nr:hypothetical protein K2173_004783 [Erythroxylum novogranatense]